MAIVKMSRFTLTAFEADKAAVLTSLQAMRDVHFSDLGERADDYEGRLTADAQLTASSVLQEKISRLRWAIDELEKLKPPPGMLESLNSALPQIGYEELEQKAHRLDVEPIYQHLREIMRESAQSREELERLKAEKERLRRYSLLDVPLDRLRGLRYVKTQLGSLPRRWQEDLEDAVRATERCHLEVLSSDDKESRVLLIYTPEEAAAVEAALRENAFTEERMDGEKTPKEMMADADKRMAELETRLAQNKARSEELAAEHLEELRLVYESLRNEKVRLDSRSRLLRSKRVFILEGYTPKERAEELQKALESCLKEPYDLKVEEVLKDDEQVEDVPIMLHNNRLVEPFESVIETYSMPRYNEIDPTAVTMPWYSLCFGMMLGDLGYGIVIFLLTTVMLRFFKMKKGMTQAFRFFRILSIPTMLAGAAYGSFFSLSFPSLISPADNSMGMLIVSIAVGVCMLFFGLGVKAYMHIRDGNPMGAVYDSLTWYLLLIGAGLLLGGGALAFPPFVKTMAIVFMIVGAVGIILFSARDQKSKGARIGWGFYNLYGVSSWVGDLVSYTRIAALALSGGFIGYAINLISGMLLGSNIVAKLAAVVVLLIFHAFNIFLSGLSGYVHTLRLTYVEFFGKFYEGGGKPFEHYRAEGEYYDVR